MYVVYVYMTIRAVPHGGQKRASRTLELEFQVVVTYLIWVLRTKHRTSARTTKCS